MKLKIMQSHYFYGPRKLNIILTQIKSSASFWNYDLFLIGSVSDPCYRCGAILENLKHFFLDCPIYLQARTTLIDNLNIVTTCYTLDIKYLTCGNVNLTDEQHCIIFKYVFESHWVNMHIIWIHLNFIFPSVYEYSSLIRY